MKCIKFPSPQSSDKVLCPLWFGNTRKQSTLLPYQRESLCETRNVLTQQVQTATIGLWGSHSLVAVPHLINPPPFFLPYFVYNVHCRLPRRSPLLVCCIGYTFRVYSLMDTPISAHHVVFLSTPAFSLRFLHTGVRERKP